MTVDLRPYQSRGFPMGAGRGGVFQAHGPGVTPYKPNKGADIAKLLMMAITGGLRGREAGRQQGLKEESQQLVDVLRQAQTVKALRPERTGKRAIRGKKNWWIIDPYTGEKTNTGIPISNISLFGELGIDEDLSLREIPAPVEGGEEKTVVQKLIDRLRGATKTTPPSKETITEPKMPMPTKTELQGMLATEMRDKLSGKKKGKSPYPEYPDAFQEKGVWKVMRNGVKYKIVD